MKKEFVLKRSLEWIRGNPDATNLDVPDKLLSYWVFNENPDENKPIGFHYAVFTFGCDRVEAARDHQKTQAIG